jgi:hypothetical protein
MKYVHLVADDDGTTHFKDGEAAMEMKDFAPPAPLINVSAHQSATEVVAINFPPGWYGDFHPAPRWPRFQRSPGTTLCYMCPVRASRNG